MNKNAFTNFDIARVLGHHWIPRRVTSIEGFRGSGSDQGGGGTEMTNIWWEGGVRSDPEKIIVTSPKLGLFLGRKAQEACPSILQ